MKEQYCRSMNTNTRIGLLITSADTSVITIEMIKISDVHLRFLWNMLFNYFQGPVKKNVLNC